MANNPYVNKVQKADGTIILDISDSTAVASDVAQGKYFYLATGEKAQGTATGGGSGGNVWQDAQGYVHLDDEGTPPITVEPLSVTQNGTYTATTGHAYSPVTVNVSGGGGSPASEKQINFIDYDGTIVESYTKTEWQSVTALPSNPSHTGLTAQGWNWTKNQIDAQLTAMPTEEVWVGQMYVTTSGDTEIDVIFADSARLSPILTIAVNGTITVDWGDGTTADTVTGTSLTTRKAVSHTYASTGSYTIVIHVTSGSFQFYGSTSHTLLRKNTSANESRVYANCVQAVRFGGNVTSIGNYAFYYCYSLASITIPSNVTSIENNAFYYCASLASITIPSNVTSIGTSAFNCCYSLASVTIPSNVTSIGNNAFYYCYSLASITIPSNVTSIGSSAFNYCTSLASITIPSNVTSIGSSAFSSCYGMAEYHILPTTAPTLGASAFASIVSDCVIYVPSASLTAYQAENNWSTYASKMVGE